VRIWGTAGFFRAASSCVALVLALSAGCVQVPQDESPVYHVDPATVREHYDAWLLFAHLGGALQSVADEQFGSSSTQLAAVRVDRAHLPSSLVDLAGRYLDLCNELSDSVERLYAALSDVDAALARNDLARARISLDSGRALLELAREKLDALERATVEVMSLLRRSGAGGTTAQLDQTREDLDEAMARLAQLALDYEARLAHAERVVEEKRSLQQPVLTLWLGRDAAWVGETVTLSGRLSAGSAALAERAVDILLDGLEVGTVSTGPDGGFLHELSVPFDYLPRRTVRVEYRPVATDLDQYRPAASANSVLTVRFHQSSVAHGEMTRVYPGLAADLSGVVESVGGVAARTVQIMWQTEVVGEAMTGLAGGFTCSVRLPEAVPSGECTLLLEVASDDANRTAPVSVDIITEVVKVAPRLDLKLTPVLLVPSPSLSLPRQLLGGDFVRMVTVSGEIASSLPLSAPAITASWGERSVRWQEMGESFEREVPLQVSIWSMGLRTVTVRATPYEPWHRPSESRAHLLVVNLFVPLVWLVVVGVAVLLGLAVRRGTTGAKVVAKEPESDDREHAAPPGRAGTGAWRRLDATGPAGMVLDAYTRAVALLQSVLGLGLRREMTLREYGRSISDRVPAISQLFGRLTALAEQALYGGRAPGRREAALGRRLLAALSGLRRGSGDGGEGGES
jgi:hypothetical protein